MTFEPIGGGLSVAVTDTVRVQEDALLLSRFAAPTAHDRAVDLGSGNGILPLLWCRREPPETIVGVEREAAFCELFRAALKRHELEHAVTVLQTDWNNEAAMPPAASMTLVTCNPPFFSPSSSRPSPDPLREAMRREDNDRTLQEVCRAAARLLCEDGRFCLCHRPARLPDVLAALDAASLTATRLQLVQSQEGVRPHLLLIEAKRHGTLTVLPTHVTADKGAATDVYHRLYTR